VAKPAPVLQREPESRFWKKLQAKEFTGAVGVTGVVLTKLDGTAKGGIALAIQSELGIPIKLVGLGETADDLVAFDPAEFVDALFD